MTIRVGNAPISWGVCELQGWGPQLPFERVLDEHAAAGYTGTELGPWGYLPRDTALLRDALEQRGLAMAGAFVPVNLRNPDQRREVEHRVRGTAGLLADLGAQHILMADDGDDRRRQIAGRSADTLNHGLSTEAWQQVAQGLTDMARICRDEYGLTTCFHSHGATYIEHPQEIDRLLAAVDDELVKFCLDTAHIAFGGGDPVAIADRYADRIGYVHIKDIHMDRLRHCLAQDDDYMTAAKQDVFVELGRGSLDLPAIIRRLQQVGYAGWIIVEQDRVVANAEMDTLSSAKESRAYLRDRFGI